MAGKTAGKDKRKKKGRRHGLRRKVVVGAPPGELVPTPDAPRASLRVVAVSGDHIDELPLEDVGALDALRAAHDFVWVDVVGVDDVEVVRAVGEHFGLHALALEDVVHQGQRPKAEIYGDHLFVVGSLMHQPAIDVLEREQISMFVGRAYVLTFQERAGDCFEPVRERLRSGRGRIRRSGADYLAYALLDALVDHFYPVFEALAERMDHLEERVYGVDDQGEVITELSTLRHGLLELRRQVWPLRDALNVLMRHDVPIIQADTTPYLGDVHDHLVRLVDLTESLRESAASLLDVHLALQSQRLNEVMKVLTIIATIFMPLSFVVGLYGMNFDTTSPYNMPELGWRFGYPAVLGSMAVVAGLLVWAFRRAGWLGR